MKKKQIIPIQSTFYKSIPEKTSRKKKMEVLQVGKKPRSITTVSSRIITFIQVFSLAFFMLFCALILVLSIRGLPGNPTSTQINNLSWKDNGPLELSPERGRYALLYSFVEDHSLQFSIPIAQFAAPDLGYSHGKYSSLFAPGVSFIVAPGYIIGKLFGIAQVGAFAVIALFALFNVFLIYRIAREIGANHVAGMIGGITYLFATPAFAYSVTLYQHQISTFLILVSIYSLLRFKGIWSLLIIWFMCGVSIAVDYPNLFMMFPIGLYALGKMISVEKTKEKVAVVIHWLQFPAFLIIIIPLLLFLQFNKLSYGNPFQLSGTLERAIEVHADGTPLLERTIVLQRLTAAEKKNIGEKSAIAFFKTRNLVNGFYEHFISWDRGMIFFTPIMLFGFAGLIYAIRRNNKYTGLFLAIIGANILLYSMWGDPYGGWAFGSRYLIPSYALFSLFISLLLSHFKKSRLFLLFFFIILGYSIAVNTLGAITSNRNPPQVEVLSIEKLSHRQEKYTFMRNAQYLFENGSKSFIYQTFAHNYVNAVTYYIILVTLILCYAGGRVLDLRLVKEEEV